MATKTIELRDFPEALRVIRAADASYKKRQAIIAECDSLELHGTAWDGGSRSTYTAVSLETFARSTAPQYDPPQFGGPRTVPKVTMRPDIAIVETGIFCGKTAIAVINVHPSNVTKLLPKEST